MTRAQTLRTRHAFIAAGTSRARRRASASIQRKSPIPKTAVTQRATLREARPSW